MEPIQDTPEIEEKEERNEIISIIAHQIRSPLATIRLSNQTLLGNSEGNLTERQIHLLEQANKRADRIYELTEELLKAEGNSIFDRELELESCDLEAFIDQLCEELNVAIRAKDLQIIKEFDEDAVSFKFDRSLLSDSMTNLLDNAISYTPDGGTITVTTQYAGDTVGVTVSDTGPGVPAQEVPKLFKKYSRLAGGVEKRHDGLGLGLHVAKVAIEKHGGSIKYEPNQPYGSSFVFTLPTNL